MGHSPASRIRTTWKETIACAHPIDGVPTRNTLPATTSSPDWVTFFRGRGRRSPSPALMKIWWAACRISCYFSVDWVSTAIVSFQVGRILKRANGPRSASPFSSILKTRSVQSRMSCHRLHLRRINACLYPGRGCPCRERMAMPNS